MKLLEKRPGEIFALLFVIGGIVLTLAVTGAEMMSGNAGNGHNGGLIDGSGGWEAENN